MAARPTYDVAALTRDYATGLSTAEIGRQHGISHSTVSLALAKAGVALRRGGKPGRKCAKRPHPQTEAVLDGWAAGETGDAISARLGVPDATVYWLVKQAREAGDARAAERAKGPAPQPKAPPKPRTHPQRDAILDGWHAGLSGAQIAERTDVAENRVHGIVQEARRKGDPRATKRGAGRVNRIVARRPASNRNSLPSRAAPPQAPRLLTWPMPAQAVHRMQMDGRGCLWPAWDQGPATLLFCGAPVGSQGPYCGACQAFAYRQPVVAAAVAEAA